MECPYCQSQLKHAVVNECISCLGCHRIWWEVKPKPPGSQED